MWKTIFCSFIVCAACVGNAQNVGVTSRTLGDPDRNRSLEVYVWYPTSRSSSEQVDRTAVYAGFSATIDAEIEVESAPLVLIAHGSYASRSSLAWLAVELAKRGAIVIAANHPGSTTGDATPASLLEIWQQPEDLRFLLQAFSQLEMGQHADFDRTAIIGTSLGGYTALALVGAQLEFERFLVFCATHDDGACQEFRRAAENIDGDFYVRANGDHTVSGIRAAVALVPGFTESMTEDSILELNAPALIIGAEFDSQVPVETHARPLAGLLPAHSLYYEIEAATHFSFLPECVEGALDILARESEEFVCEEPTDKTRSQIHEEVIDVISQFLVQQGVLGI